MKRFPLSVHSAALSVTTSLACCLFGLALAVSPAAAQEAQWIWTPAHDKDNVPAGACYFRKTFTLAGQPENAQIMVAADDTFDVYVNSRQVGTGESTRRLVPFNITRYLNRGRNTVAIRVENTRGKTAALAARVMVKPTNGGWASFSTDASWKTQLNPLPLWNLPIYNDSRWDAAQSFGPLGKTPPWDRAEDVAETQQEQHERFHIAPEFAVTKVLDGDTLGSLIAMTFNEFGHIIASREGGPLLLITDSNNDKLHDKIRVYCDKVTSCQGILALNGDVYVTGEGPEGAALYRLADRDRDGQLEDVKALLKFDGPMGEHGPHGLVLGPDGMIYLASGNHAKPMMPIDASSPHYKFYEGDLVGPRYEDPGGHAMGVKAPGGAVLRMDLEGNNVQVVAGGLRNAYDLAFNQQGELFVHDSDMESDVGAPWYRPTHLYHVIAGAEFGWRSGWAKWPNYYVDAVPEVLETGRGSPTGAEFYNHFMFPTRYHDAMFLADWSEGRILAVRMKKNGASYTASSEEFLRGEPLNVTDLAVGPDGALYFTTGGRGTAGAIYRITWKGKVPESITNVGTGLTAVIRQPQLSAAWSRQAIAGARREVGDAWDRSMIGVAKSAQNPANYRLRALDLMQLYGPAPTPEFLITLASDQNEQVRAKAARLMGQHADETTRDKLVELLGDDDRAVRREAAESLIRAGQQAPLQVIYKLVVSDDRFEAWAGRRLLERVDPAQWREDVLASDDQRLFIEGALALLIAAPDRQGALAVIDRCEAFMDGFISDRNFVDMLRLMQLALQRGQLAPSDVFSMRDKLAREFPSGDPIMNRELVRLLTYLNVTSITDRYMAYLKSDIPESEKLHVAMHLRLLKDGMNQEQKRDLLAYYESAQQAKFGNSIPHYLRNAAKDFALSLGPEDGELLLADGEKWPSAALGALYKLPQVLDPATIEMIKRLDGKIAGDSTEAAERLKVGIVAVLARSGDEASYAYLRDVWTREPERRQATAMGLAQAPEGENWQYLVDSLPVLEGGAAQEVLKKLAAVDKTPQNPDALRNTILLGLTLKEEGGELAADLLSRWTGEQPAEAGDDWKKSLAAWQAWYGRTYPDRPAAELPVAKENAAWDYKELLTYLTGDEADGAPERGAEVFAKAQCAKCHRHGDQGESMGPDLTSLAKRFMKKEILQSIVFPSHVVSDQYAAKQIVTTQGKQFVGILAPGPAGSVIVLQANGEKVEIPQRMIEETVPSKLSAMPEGLLDTLTLEEISDLFAYLTTTPQEDLARKPGE
ncbi:MAG: HEAT repeat domain-containing protein [Pirellulaceae bacterium]